jgi:hypothetical protein
LNRKFFTARVTFPFLPEKCRRTYGADISSIVLDPTVVASERLLANGAASVF